MTLLNLKGKSTKTFETFIKPTIEPKLSEFCINKTGVTQNDVDSSHDIQNALKQIHNFLGESMFASEFVFLTVGDNDLRLLREEAC